MRKYRTVVQDWHGPYVAYQGLELAEALASMERHEGAHVVHVDWYDPTWGGSWRCVQGVWR